MIIHDKHYLEEYARQSLFYVLEFDITNYFCKDKPDIQNNIEKIGIEVVEDVYETTKELERFWEKYESVKYDEIPQKVIDGYYKRQGTLKVKNNRLYGGSLGESKPNSPKHLISVIDKKIKKLNMCNYDSFDYYYLYVFVNTVDLYDSYIHEIIQHIHENTNIICYSKLILNNYYELCFCDRESQTYKRFDISKDMRELMEEKTKEALYNKNRS